MLAIDTETTGLFIHKGCRAFTISAACDSNKTYLWNFEVDPLTREVIYDQPTLEHFTDTMALHEELIFHNANFDLQALVAIGFDLEEIYQNHDIHDTMVMSHAYKSNNTHGLKELGVTLLGFPKDDEQRLSKITQAAQAKAKRYDWCLSSKSDPHYTLRGTQKEWYKADYWVPAHIAKAINLPPDHEWHTICNEYAEKDAIRTIGIFHIFQELLTAKQKIAYHKARKLIKPILKMQYEKTSLIREELAKAKKIYQSKYDEHEANLKTIIRNKAFNSNSPKQLKEVLFDTLKFKPMPGKEGKDGPSTDKNVIIHLLKDCPVRGKLPTKYKFLVELKRLRKAKTTLQYINNYYAHKSPSDLLQPFYKQTATATNRLSCENPNLTNVGKKDSNNPFGDEPGIEHLSHLFDTEEKFKLRNVFGPREGEIWTCIDYQQFQLLIFAVVSNSKPLLEAFEQGADVHNAVAQVLFKSDNISANQRTAAKAINFGLLFGAGPGKIELLAGIPGLYNQFLSAFPNAKTYLSAQSAQARKKGYVHTLGGYRLYVPRDRAYAASCYVIQGSEAEIVRSAMCSVSEYTYNNSTEHISQKYRSQLEPTRNPCPYKMIMMVHDELVFRSKTTHHKHLHNLMRLMEIEALKVGVPAKVDADIVTKTWADKVSYEKP